MPAPTHASPESEATRTPVATPRTAAPEPPAPAAVLGAGPVTAESDDTDWDALETRPRSGGTRPRSGAVTERPAPGGDQGEKADEAERAAEREVRKAAVFIEADAKLKKKVAAQTVTVAKGMEKAEDAANAAARQRGTAGRRGLQAGVAAQLGTGENRGVQVKDSELYVDITSRVEAVMNRFHQRHQQLCTLFGVAYEDTAIAAMPKEEQREERQHRRRFRYQAFDEVWGTLEDPVLRFYRPQLGTSSERLVSEILEERAAASKGGDIIEASDKKVAYTKGAMLDEDVEAIFDTWAERAMELEKDEATRGTAADTAYAEVCGRLSSEDAQKLPKDDQLRRAARRQARARLAARLRLSPDGVVRSDEMTDVEAVESVASTAAGVGKAGKTAAAGVSWAVGKAGKDATESLRNAAVASGAQRPGAASPSAASSVPGIASVARPIEDAVANKANGVRDPQKLAEVLPKSVVTQAAEGIGTVASFLRDVLVGFDAVLKMIRGIGEAHEAGTTEKRLVATKATADGAAGLARITSSTAKFASLCDPGVASAVAQFVPGLQIGVAAVSLASSAVDTVRVGRHMRDADAALLAARFRSVSGGEVDVLVRPMLLTTSLLTQNFENCVWGVYQGISSLTTSILTVAGGGLFGIPAAVDAGNKVLNLLHKGGHAVANQVRAYQAMEAKAAGVAAAEGSGEQRLAKSPGLAVEGILHLAATKKDGAALAFLENYDITAEVLASTPMGELSERLLADLGTDGEPTTLFAKFKEGYGRFSRWLDEDSGPSRWDQVGQMTADRNRLDGGDRGTAFKIKKYLDVLGLDRSLSKTKESRIVCEVGKHQLRGQPELDQVQEFVEAIASPDVTEEQITAALKDPRTEAVFHETLRRELVKRAAPRYKNKPVPPPPTRPRSSGGPPPLPAAAQGRGAAR